MAEYCDCRSLMILCDSNMGTPMYQCPLCDKRKPVTGTGTLLHSQIFSGTEVDTSNYKDFLASISSDPTNARVQIECPNCHMSYMAFCLIGNKGKPYLTCGVCKSIYYIDRLKLFNQENEKEVAEPKFGKKK